MTPGALSLSHEPHAPVTWDREKGSVPEPRSLGKPRLRREWTRSVRVRTQTALGARRALPNGDTAPSWRTVTRKNSERLVDADNSAVIAGGRRAYRD